MRIIIRVLGLVLIMGVLYIAWLISLPTSEIDTIMEGVQFIASDPKLAIMWLTVGQFL